MERGLEERYTPPMERLGLGHYLTDLTEPPGPYLYPLLAGLFALVLLVGLYLLTLRAEGRLPAGKAADLARRVSAPVALSSSSGLLAIAAAYRLTPFLSKRIWPAIALAALVASIAMALVASRAPGAARRDLDPAAPPPADR
jgi:hypothetical protein